MDQNKISLLGRHAEIMSKFYDRINRIHKRPLNVAQIVAAKDYFVRGMRVSMSQWARDLGKTEAILYIANVAATLNDKVWIMIVCPELKQGRKIYWHKRRLQDYAPPEFLDGDPNSTEMKITFKNGSIITVEGCENYESLRGSKPDFVIYDEFQDHNKEFHLEVMQPNLTREHISLFIFGTPPKRRSAYYVQFREELLQRIKDGASDEAYHEYDAYNSTVASKARLDQRKKELFASGEEAIWYREYEAKLVFGGEDVVFPKWEPKRHKRSHSVVMSYLEQDKKKLKWFTMCDPGTSTCFAVLFICYNPYTQQIYFLDEIYEKDRSKTTARQIWDRIRLKEKELYPEGDQRAWRRIYDEAAAWFHNEIASLHRGQRLNLTPTRKHESSTEAEISRIKMAMGQEGAFIVSDRCYWFIWEIESYITVKDKNGDATYVDSNNHQIDNCCYFMQASGWTLMEKAEDILYNANQVMTLPVTTVETWAEDALEKSLYPENYVNNRYSDFFN